MCIRDSNNVGGEDGSRFGLSVFSSGYRSVFYLSTYSTKAQYFTAVSGVTKGGGGTNLGYALTQVQRFQFSEFRGLRPEEDGLPRILVVLTDGRSSGNVSRPAMNISNNNIVVYAIGIGNYDIVQLNEIATSPSESHVIELNSFTDLADFASTLTASTCNEPQPISLDKKISGSVAKGAFQYYKFKIPSRGSNLKVDLNDLAGRTLFYASRDNPHPYQYDNTFGFTSSASSQKTIVIAPEGSQITQVQFIYISVTADTDRASFTVQGATCDPSVCSEGISQASVLQAPLSVMFIAVVIVIAMTLFPQ